MVAEINRHTGYSDRDPCFVVVLIYDSRAVDGEASPCRRSFLFFSTVKRYPSYQAAPSFAYIIGEYTLDRNGVLTGPRNSRLMLTLDQVGYRTK